MTQPFLHLTHGRLLRLFLLLFLIFILFSQLFGREIDLTLTGLIDFVVFFKIRGHHQVSVFYIIATVDGRDVFAHFGAVRVNVPVIRFSRNIERKHACAQTASESAKRRAAAASVQHKTSTTKQKKEKRTNSAMQPKLDANHVFGSSIGGCDH